MYGLLTIFAFFILLYSATAGGISRTPISGAIVFTVFGLMVGPLFLGWLHLDIGNEGLRSVAELTLAVVLFTDAANADLGALRKNSSVPERLLLLGLPLTILLGFLAAGLVFPQFGLLELAVLATILAPTDAALGAAVVADERVPTNIRQGLNVESGLNDGICVPVLFLFLALTTGPNSNGDTAQLATSLFAQEIGIGAAVGLSLAFVTAQLLKFCTARDWVTDTWRQLPVIALAIACFSLAQYFDGSGFIASFVGGLVWGGLSKSHKQEFLLAADGTGQTLGLITWVIFGAVVVGQSINGFTWEVLIYAFLSLTAVRMIPVLLVLTRTGLTTREKLFVSWFGPRGLASIVFGLIVVNEHLPNGEVISSTVVATVVLSVVLHGLTANPLIAALSRRLAGSTSGQT